MKPISTAGHVPTALAALTLYAMWLLVMPVGLIAQETAVQPDLEIDQEFDTAIHVESFDIVWNTIKKTHWNPDLVGDSWDAAREKYRPQVESAASEQEVRQAITEMLGTLEQSHFGIIAHDEYDTYNEERGGGGGEGTAGLEVRLVEEQLVVTRVLENFPAAEAGVQSGWIVKLIGNRTSDEILKGAKVVGEHSVVRLDTAVGLVCDARVSGDVGDKLAFAFVDHDQEVRLEYLELVKAPGKPETFGHLPTFNVHFESKELDGEIGYIAFNSFIGGPRLNREYQQAIKDYRGKNGLIIDLRGNRGGLVLLVAAMCGWLTGEKEAIGKMTATGGNSMNMILNPRRPRYNKPVAVLTDECSISAAEIMAGGIKDLGLGRVFGNTTAGLSLPSTVVKLPNGDGFQYAISTYESASGESIEGIGVVPNEPIVLTREMLSKTADPVLSAAKKWILEQNKE